MRTPDTLNTLHRALDFHAERHTVLSANLAHMDTPGFHPLDLAHEGSFSSELRAAMTTTSPGHRGGTSVSESSGSVIEATQAVGFDDNGVSLDREAAKLAANNVRYDALANVMSHSLSMLNWAANDGKGG